VFGDKTGGRHDHDGQQYETAAEPQEFFQGVFGVRIDAFGYFTVFVVQD